MKVSAKVSPTFLLLFVVAFTALYAAQGSQNGRLLMTSSIEQEHRDDKVSGSPASEIIDIQVIASNSVVLFTRDAIYRTDDGGETWEPLNLLQRSGSRIASVYFDDKTKGYAVIAEPVSGTFELAKTTDGGKSWNTGSVFLPGFSEFDIHLESCTLRRRDPSSLELVFRIETSSNFDGFAVYHSNDDGGNWRFESRSMELRQSGPVSPFRRKGNWSVESVGSCYSGKYGCVQQSVLRIGSKIVTPPKINEIAAREMEKARNDVENMHAFSLLPGGYTRVSFNRGFDLCNAPTAAQMQIWWNNSPFYDVNIYMSGRNRACSAQPNLSAAWVNQVSAMGWGIIPTIVGYQSPCTASATTAKLSYDPAFAEQQGRGEADIAVADASNLGITTGSILYYDMERYDPPVPDTLGCRAATVAFLKGWTDRVKELGFKSGVYGSPKNAQEDWVALPPASKMDAIWMARWDNVPSVWTYVTFPNFPTAEWANNQRIKQYQGPHNETWGGVTFNIDGDISAGPVAGLALAKNRIADYDGDGKTDASVWRPLDATWYVSRSKLGDMYVMPWGLAGDNIVPADYDGDGKTDLAVRRPADNNFYIFNSSNSTMEVRNFGISGDIALPSDYNGDGKADVAVWRPSNGTWYLSLSGSGIFYVMPWGLAADKPVPGDYDGDGKTDLAVFRPTEGRWYMFNTVTGAFSTNDFGMNGDTPVQADYSGDGKTDFAVYRASNNTWYRQHTNDGTFNVSQWGLAGDFPTPGDFDGDGRTDVAVWRPSNGTWYVLKSTSGVFTQSFGTSGDTPTPNAFVY